MSGEVHQLFAGEADRDAAWQRYAELAQAMESDPSLRRDRDHVDRTFRAFREYQRLYEISLERGRR